MSPKTPLYHRHFSEPLKREIVKELDSKLLSVGEAMKRYNVSRTSIHKWLRLYSSIHQTQTRLIMEKKSQASQVTQLKRQIQELEAALGRKQMELDYKNKLIELAEQHYQIDIEKKSGSSRSSGSEKAGENTLGK